MKGKTYGSRSKKGEMKRSSSKKNSANNSKDFGPGFYNKYGHPGGIGLYGPGKFKINKEKPNVSSRGSARWNKSPANGQMNKMSKPKINELSQLNNSGMLRNNFMNNSKQRDDSPLRKDKGSSKYELGRKTAKELIQMKQENKNKIKDTGKPSDDSSKENAVGKNSTPGNAFKIRKLSADHNRSERNSLKDIKNTNRSRKSQSSKPTHRVSRADSRDTSTRSNKEGANDKPSNGAYNTKTHTNLDSTKGKFMIHFLYQ